MHSYHPFNPENLDEDEEDIFEFEPGELTSYEREIVDIDFNTDDIREMANLTFWFEERDTTLDDILDGEEAALIKVSYETTENGELVEETEQFLVLTEDSDWRVFFPTKSRRKSPTTIP